VDAVTERMQTALTKRIPQLVSIMIMNMDVTTTMTTIIITITRVVNIMIMVMYILMNAATINFINIMKDVVIIITIMKIIQTVEVDTTIIALRNDLYVCKYIYSL
jgi:hypothetical protein